ncbi:MAG TPA: hypothetical protein VNZ57_10985 [Longimicrobiales bacterium]|nr:hypothetical protein [Longimicrobiales bacterium]
MSGSSPGVVRYGLLVDGSLEVEVEAGHEDAVLRWLPLSSVASVVAPADAAVRSPLGLLEPARIHVGGGDIAGKGGAHTDTTREPLLRLMSVAAWRAGPGREYAIASARGQIDGLIDIERGRADVMAHAPETESSRRAMFYALTLAAAFLVLRGHRALMHAAAVAPPGGDALLLVGDARAGKSTTVANLMSAGWEYLSDDQVVISQHDTGVVVEGWPRRFHLDAGWHEARVTGLRETVDPAGIGTGSFRRAATVGAVVFPRVAPGGGTRLEPVTASNALAQLIRQSPWLLVDAPTAPAVLACLTRAASLPTYRLLLDRDTYADPERLARIVAPLTLRQP